MTRSLRIAVAEDEPELLEDLVETLGALGHNVIVAVQTGEDLVARCGVQRPDLVITDIKMSDMDGLEAVQKIGVDAPLPVIITSAYHDPEYVERALQGHVLAYLVKPIDQADLKVSITLAMQRFREFQALHQETSDLRQALHDRKIVERAKGILMRRAELSEADAFRRLQDLASTKNQKMVQIANTIVTAEDAFRPPS